MKYARLAGLLAVIAIALMATFTTHSTQAQSPEREGDQGLSTPQLINQAYAEGQISAEERLLNLAYAIYEHESLSEEFEATVGWYGTSVVRELHNAYANDRSSFSPAVRNELNRLLNSAAATICDKEDMANNDQSDNFYFNYGTIGGGLDIEAYKTSMETTFATEVTSYGWANPPLCTADSCDNDNPFDKYPIQIAELKGGLYGYVTSNGGNYTGVVGNNPNTTATETAAVASCMVLNSDFSKFPEGTQGALDGTTSHEFVHSIQFGYGDAGEEQEDGMWYESSAAYLEDDIFDDSNSQYQYLWPPITSCLGEWSGNVYTNFLFFRHVAEHNGGTNVAGGGEDIMQQFWANVAAGEDGLIAYNNALVAEGTDSNNLPDAYHKYAIAAKFSKACGAGYESPYCFEEGAAYVTAQNNELIPAQGTIESNTGSYNGDVEDNYATNYVSLPTSGSYSATLNNSSGGGELRGSLVCDTGSAFNITAFPDVAGNGNSTKIDSFDASGCTSVVAVITNQAQTSGNPAQCTATRQAGRSYALSLGEASPTAVTTAQFSATNSSSVLWALLPMGLTFLLAGGALMQRRRREG